ncbi:hypothetical protein DTO166G4_781 [Paecilomyces variotii]|nr:hypothetical protein DTO164E3_1731 [Paecilomyces variotii]KAJ9217599.1 hypothetical protein DTO166G4_781 [Paecilomyces variotii]KAJ9238548.1 hypothetical protein DTO169E5_4748 [Paecilomyces variotii]KAJ9391027.1 hypothetical protein DTO032I4_1383 [Paecilomyces variotii]
MMTVLARHRTLLPPAVLELRIVDMARQAVYPPPRMTTPGLCPVDLPQIGGVITPERGNPGRTTTEAEIEIAMTTVVDRHAPHLAVGGPDTEIATAKAIALQTMTAAAEATVGAAVHDEAVHTMATKARK